MKIIIKISVLILLFVFGSSSYAQNESLRFEHIGYGDGLSSESVTAILQDTNGYIWIATWDGLNKYDEYTGFIGTKNKN